MICTDTTPSKRFSHKGTNELALALSQMDTGGRVRAVRTADRRRQMNHTTRPSNGNT